MLAYSFAGYLSIQAGLIALFLLLLLVPLAVVQSLRFNSSNSAWRGVRFGFDGSFRQAYPPHFFWLLFGVATFGIGLPFALYKINQFQFNNYRFGTTRSSSSATVKGFYGIWLRIFFATVLAFILLIIVLTATIALADLLGGPELAESTEWVTVTSIILTWLVLYVGIVGLYQALYYRLVFNNLEVGGNRLQNSISIKYIGVILVNTILIIVTLGFFYPWAAVRRTRYLLSNMRLEAGELDAFTAGELDHISAEGDEFGEAFDLGIGI